MNRFEPTPEHPGKTWTGFFHLLSKKESRAFLAEVCLQSKTSNKVVPREVIKPFRPYQRDERAFLYARRGFYA
ncbi:hypothetical protein A616_26940 [Brevibacillus brevis X23]|uniref:Uncharacterized protein n=1 Tax=Brevibacillus porteri TaxID=2126350 RepID=A0ABX5FR86_9BACL|nr:hypothetical protein A616_26940 [Brevibacillus brevis X23]PSK10753.1 hypothetical protein C7R92_12000 [Brevibacillus porteri]